MVVARIIGLLGGSATFAQVLLSLPMTLDLLGAPSFLLLSLLFTLHHFFYSTVRLLLKNTPLAPLVAFLSILSPFFATVCISTTLYFYLHPPDATASTGLLPSASHILVNVLPYTYANVLRWVSPLFTLAEGISTLLVIQVVGKVGKGWADEEEKEEGIEWRGLLGLVAAALVYCLGLAGLIMEFPTGPASSLPAFLLGCAITTVLFLSLIGFSLRRTNVLETSLVFVYVVYTAWLSGVESKMEPRTYGSGWLPSPATFPPSKPLSFPETTVQGLFSRAASGIFDSVADIALNLPHHLLLSLVYRVVVLHFAARIIPAIRKYSMGYDDGMQGDAKPGFWDGRSLTEEPMSMRPTTVVLAYRRAILIAVYTHLLLLDAGSQTWWRWINITLFLATWSLELLLEADDDGDSVTRWKIE